MFVNTRKNSFNRIVLARPTKPLKSKGWSDSAEKTSTTSTY